MYTICSGDIITLQKRKLAEIMSAMLEGKDVFINAIWYIFSIESSGATITGVGLM